MDNLKALGPLRGGILGAAFVVISMMILFGVTMATAPNYVTVHSGLSLSSASQVVQTLEGSGFRVQVDGGGTIIRVPQNDVARARMTLAEQGLPSEGSPGWEIFDESTGLGMNSFMQQISRLRALEGELARSIRTIQGIEAARVHLVLPDREAFSRVRPEPSASVIVQTHPAFSLGHRQALAIRSLVASAVPGLSGSRVTILSATGESILPENGEMDANMGAMAATAEERLMRSVSDILSARVGAGNVRISVNVRLNNEREILRQQDFDPEGQVVRSTEVREEQTEDRTDGNNAVDVAENIPPGLGGGTAGGGSLRSSNTNNTVTNFEISTTQREVVREPGQIERVSIAVLVNGIFTTDDTGARIYADRSPEELERLSELVRTAVGFDASRGDTVSVDSFQFADYLSTFDPVPPPSLMQLVVDNFDAILQGLFTLLIVGLALLLGIRPIIRAIAPEKPKNTASGQPAEMGIAVTAGGAPGSVQVIAGAKAGNPVLGKQSSDDSMMVNLEAVEANLHKDWITSLGEMIEQDPDRALRVIQTWLSEED